MTESLGPVTDHGFEHLAPSDRMITQTRRRCLLAARRFRETGETPPGVDEPAVLYRARSGFFVADAAVEFDEAFERQLADAHRAATLTMAAE